MLKAMIQQQVKNVGVLFGDTRIHHALEAMFLAFSAELYFDSINVVSCDSLANGKEC